MPPPRKARPPPPPISPSAPPARSPRTRAPAAPADAAAAEWPSKEVVDGCRRCPLWERATQGVPGEGAKKPAIILVGEQPGDEEDLAGRPFVGPAGRLLRRLLEEAGIDPASVYITNAVKHFSWQARGKRRIHKTPAQREVDACYAWLEAEITRLKPRVVVALGGTAIVAVLGQPAKVGESRGQDLRLPDGTHVVATFHPSAALRAPDPDRREELQQALRDDLARAARLASNGDAD